jgi:probable HAF family extracellular repeat protein
MKTTTLLIALFALLNIAPSAWSATIYSITDLGTLGGFASYGYGINASGEVTGEAYTTGGSEFHAFLYDGTMHDLGMPGGIGGFLSYGNAINASGQVTGNGNKAGGSSPYHAFLYDGTMHDLGTLGGTYSEGDAINALGQVAGVSSTTGNAAYHAFLYDGTMHDLGTALNGEDTAVHGINESGHIVGDSNTALGHHAFLYDGTMHDLGTLGGTRSYGYGINDSGQVTGYFYLSNGLSDAFLYDAAHGMVDLNSLIGPSSGWTLAEGEAINDRGQITGFGTIGGATHAFLLTPLPEPSTFVLGAVGMIGLLGYVRRARRASR